VTATTWHCFAVDVF